MFKAQYVGESSYSMRMAKTYTVFWVKTVETGKTYFLVCDNAGDFSWFDKDEFRWIRECLPSHNFFPVRRWTGSHPLRVFLRDA